MLGSQVLTVNRLKGNWVDSEKYLRSKPNMKVETSETQEGDRVLVVMAGRGMKRVKIMPAGN